MARKKSATKKTLKVQRVKRTPGSTPALFRLTKSRLDFKKSFSSFWNKLNYEAETNQSKLSMVLGALIILVVGILVFNYFNQQKPALGPSQQAENTQDVAPQNLPGKYKVKDGDTLYQIAQTYYQDGYQYTEVAKANNLTDPNSLEVGQILDIPKLSFHTAASQASPSANEQASPQTTPSGNTPPVSEPSVQNTQPSGPMDTVWGPAITSDIYIVKEGDWLSKISARSYGDIFAYGKIAAANNIQNPDLILPGQVLKIPR